jgi:hypothetical protein
VNHNTTPSKESQMFCITIDGIDASPTTRFQSHETALVYIKAVSKEQGIALDRFSIKMVGSDL